MNIAQADILDFEHFFHYLDIHLSENGIGSTPLFQPVSMSQAKVSVETKAKFINGFHADLDDVAWRKLWLVKDDIGQIVAHIDLRRHDHKNSLHRVLLGIGVASEYRQQGLGHLLIQTVSDFCRKVDGIDWIDLSVLSENIPAKNLYLKCGFSIVGELIDQFRLDGKSVSETLMTKNIRH